jgi:hypothetical protein
VSLQKFARSVFFLSFILAASCVFDSAAPTALIACGPQAECPETLACRKSTQRCIPKNEIEIPLPTATVELTLRAPAQSLAQRVTAATRGSTARIAVAVAGRLGGEPTVTGPPDFPCGLVSAREPLFVFQCEFSPRQDAEGEGQFVLRLRAATNEEVEIPIEPRVALDSLPPRALDMSTASRARLERVPWGSKTTLGAAASIVHLGAGVVPALAEVLLLQEGEVFARAVARNDGSADISSELDLDRVEVAALDAAGNATDPAIVKSVSWVATPVGRVVNQAFPNPNAVRAYGAWSNGIVRRDGIELGAADGVDFPDDGRSFRVKGTASWERRQLNLTPLQQFPSIARGPNLIWDEARAQGVWAGANNGSHSGESSIWQTYTWTGRGWVDSDPALGEGFPVSRENGSVWYDPQTATSWLWGGDGISPDINQMWWWDGTSWHRGDVVKGARGRAITFYDRARREIWVCGGQPGLLYLGTRSRIEQSCLHFDLRGKQLSSGSQLPQALTAASSTINSKTGQGYAFGGVFADAGVSAQTLRFSFDGGVFETLVTPGPPARSLGAMAWDPSRDVAVLYGGTAADGRALNDTWEFNGTVWVQKVPIAAPGCLALPPSCANCGLVTDLPHGEVLLVTENLETWAWNGTSWCQRSRNDVYAPATPSRSAMACDPAGDTCFAVTDKSYVRRAGVWQPIQPLDGYRSAPLMSKSIAWDPYRKTYGMVQTEDRKAVLRSYNPVKPDPNVRPNYWPMDWKSSDDYILEPYLAATPRSWAISGSKTFPVEEFPFFSTGNIGDNIGAFAVSLGDGGVLVEDFEGISYQFSGGSWSSRSSSAFSQFGGVAATFDGRRARAMALGGGEIATPRMTIQELTGNGWQNLDVSDPEGDGNPTPRAYFGAAYDPLSKKVMIHGGQEGYLGPLLGDTWDLEITDNRPAVVFEVAAQASIPKNIALDALRFTARAGAFSAESTGVEALCFIQGVWYTVASLANASLASPALITGELRDPRLLRGVQEAPTLSCGLRTKGFNGLSVAELSVDSLEISLDYHLR